MLCIFHVDDGLLQNPYQDKCIDQKADQRRKNSVGDQGHLLGNLPPLNHVEDLLKRLRRAAVIVGCGRHPVSVVGDSSRLTSCDKRTDIAVRLKINHAVPHVDDEQNAAVRPEPLVVSAGGKCRCGLAEEGVFAAPRGNTDVSVGEQFFHRFLNLRFLIGGEKLRLIINPKFPSFSGRSLALAAGSKCQGNNQQR